MSVFKCKMCGGTLELVPGDTVGVCDSCGTKQTLPKTNDDVIANLFNRANNLRLKCEFDKAEQIYEKIVEQNAEDCEAHWGIVLCKYGIEYVEDPKTLSRVPTCHRTLFEAVTTDADYLAAIANADDAQKEIYQNEARAIDKIQKNILAIVKNEKPFDVFICYKETDENGKRTVDSTVANDIYYQLTKEGLKVFYAAITLENKLGQEYEPYIFAALNSAKVMLVIGTKPEYFEAVWVKNEWSRFLNLMKTDRNKLLIPCYRDMDAYDLPEAFAHLQAQDMGKIGFINDLIHGIKKMTKTESAAAPQSETAPSAGNIAPLLKRAKMFLEDGEWQKADDFCEQVLNQDPECAEAYLYKLMAEQHARNREDLPNLDLPFDNSNYYEKILRFGDGALKNELAGYIDHINERNDYEEKDEIYENAVSLMDAAKTELDFKAAAAKFAEIPEHRDAEKLKEECLEKAEISRKDTIYTKARKLMKYGVIPDYEEAATLLQSISGWKDSNEQIYACQKGIEEIKAKEEAERLERERKAEENRIAVEKLKKRNRKILLVASAVLAVAVIARVLAVYVFVPLGKYNDAVKLKNEGKLEEAITAFAAMEDYKDSADQILECYYEKGITLQSESKTAEAYTAFRAAEGYKDSAEKASENLKSTVTNANVGDTFIFGAYEQDNDLSNGAESIEWRVLAKEDNKVFLISKYALDCKPYNTSFDAVTWETCSLREWLNGDFLNAAFTANEQTFIADTFVSADENPEYSTNPGNATTDKVFLLSVSEVENYLPLEEVINVFSTGGRLCMSTAYARNNDASVETDDVNDVNTIYIHFICWWLRDPDREQNSAFIVQGNGSFFSKQNVTYDVYVRPAIWIAVES